MISWHKARDKHGDPITLSDNVVNDGVAEDGWRLVCWKFRGWNYGWWDIERQSTSCVGYGCSTLREAKLRAELLACGLKHDDHQTEVGSRAHGRLHGRPTWDASWHCTCGVGERCDDAAEAKAEAAEHRLGVYSTRLFVAQKAGVAA